MKKILLFLLIPTVLFSQGNVQMTGEMVIYLANYGSSWNVTFNATTNDARWGEDYYLTSGYATATRSISSPYSTAAYFDLIVDVIAGQNPIMALGKYKISAIEGGIEQAYFYMDWRTSDYDNSPDVDFKYDVINNHFWNYAETEIIDGSTQTVWDLNSEIDHVTSGLELYLTITSVNNWPHIAWNDYFNTDFVPNQFKIYRSIRSTFPTSESHFNCIATVSRNTRSYTDMSYEIGDDSKAWYRVKAYKSTSPTKYSLPSNIEGIDIDFPSKGSTFNNSSSGELIYRLYQNHPNPFNPRTTINYELKENSFVSLNVYNALGEMVASLVNKNEEVGIHSIDFNASDLPSGIYLYKITADNFIQVKKMILLR